MAVCQVKTECGPGATGCIVKNNTQCKTCGCAHVGRHRDAHGFGWTNASSGSDLACPECGEISAGMDEKGAS